jgi:hypothetical protein
MQIFVKQLQHALVLECLILTETFISDYQLLSTLNRNTPHQLRWELDVISYPFIRGSELDVLRDHQPLPLDSSIICKNLCSHSIFYGINDHAYEIPDHN